MRSVSNKDVIRLWHIIMVVVSLGRLQKSDYNDSYNLGDKE